MVKVTDVLLASHENTAQIIEPARLHVLTQKLMNLAQVYVGTYSRSTECSVDGTGARRRTKTTDELDAIFFGRGVSYDKPLSSVAVLV